MKKSWSPQTFFFASLLPLPQGAGPAPHLLLHLPAPWAYQEAGGRGPRVEGPQLPHGGPHREVSTLHSGVV